jgi:aldehyde:ferredoxin oxidoreductase
MDTISCGATIAFAIECYEKGLVTREDTGGVDLSWGNAEAIITVTKDIAARRGFGDILSEGSARAALGIGSEAVELLTTVKGLESPMHDPRSAHGYGLAYAVSPRGACHMASLDYSVESGGMFLPEIPECAEMLDETNSEGKAALNIACQDYGMFFSSCAIFCNLGAIVLNATQAVEAVNAVTGFDYTLKELMGLGRRLWYLKRGISNLFGARAEHDRLPRRLMTVLDEGPSRGSLPDMDLMLREFYAQRRLTVEGVPEAELLRELGLEKLAELLHS